MKAKIIVIHYSPSPGEKLSRAFSKDWQLTTSTGQEALLAMKREPFDAALLYFEKKTSAEAEDLLKQIQGEFAALPVIGLTSAVDMELAVKMMKLGAEDYFQLPVIPETLKHAVEKAIKMYHLTHKVSFLEQQAGRQGKFDDMVGASSPMHEIFKMIEMVSKSNATVLIIGESGTGKELVAKAVHNHSDRVKKKFIDINCGAIPRELLENELFGHERGSYTGADRRYIGSCERAHGGTLFLDEISEMDPALQVKLLRVLQERTFSRVGGTERIYADIRIIAATNKDIQAEVERGRFREDLFYRLNVVPIHMPPLRSRRDDIPLLARYFLAIYSSKNHKNFAEFDNHSLEAMVQYDWPGNVRELENVVERLVVLHDDTKVRPAYLPRFVRQAGDKSKSHPSSLPTQATQDIIPLELVERYAIEAAVSTCHGDIPLAAKKLKVGQATLYRKLRRYGIR